MLAARLQHETRHRCCHFLYTYIFIKYSNGVCSYFGIILELEQKEYLCPEAIIMIVIHIKRESMSHFPHHLIQNEINYSNYYMVVSLAMNKLSIKQTNKKKANVRVESQTKQNQNEIAN